MESHSSDLVDGIEAEVDRKGMGGGNIAADSARLAYNARSFGTPHGAIREVQAIQAAMAECAAHLTGRTVAFDSAASVYSEALITMGHRHSISDVPPSGLQAVYRLAARAGGPGPSRVASDTARTEFGNRFPDAAKLVGGR